VATFRINARQIQRINARLVATGKRLGDMREPMNLIGLRLLNTREEIFELQGSPAPWKPSQRAIREGGFTLIDTRALLNSMTQLKAKGQVFDARPNSVEVGSMLKHAAVHDDGATIKQKRGKKTVTIKIPRRRFTNLRAQDRKAVVEVLEGWIGGLFDKGA